MTVTIVHKRGDTFSKALELPAALPDEYFIGWNAAAQVRTVTGRLVDDLTVDWLDEPTRKTLGLFIADTRAWKIADLNLDVQFTRISDGFVLSTETIVISVLMDVTLVP